MLDKDLVEIVGAIASGVSILSFPVLIYQAFRARGDRLLEMRPRVSIELSTKGSGKNAFVTLTLSNTGRTSAEEVILEFPEDAIWHHVRPSDFPFLSAQSGIAVLSPNQSMSYRLGLLVPHLVWLRKETLDVTLTYRHEGSRRAQKQNLKLSLRDSKFLIKGAK